MFTAENTVILTVEFKSITKYSLIPWKKGGEGRTCYLWGYLLLSCTAGFRVWLVAELTSCCVVLVEPNFHHL